MLIKLLVVFHQCTAEVNSLRAMRIEILQGMQGTVHVLSALNSFFLQVA